MPARLSIHPDDEGILVLKLGGSSEEFRAQLARAKTVPGRRYNAADKTWEFPNTPDVLFKVVNTIEPTLDDGLKDRVETAQQEAAEEIITHLPDDAALTVPWRGRLVPKQRAGVDFLAEHPHALLADDMGAGKTVQSITAVYEYAIRAMVSSDGVLEVQNGQAPDGVLCGQENGSGASEPVQGVHAGGDACAPPDGAQDDSTGSGTAVYGLRSRATVAVHGAGSRTGKEDSGSSELAGLAQNGGEGAGQVRGSLPELPSFAASPSLVIAPKSVLGHWRRELAKWADVPPEKVLVLGEVGTKNSKGQSDYACELREFLGAGGEWVLVNWEKLQARFNLVGETKAKPKVLDKIKWGAILADEAHRAKNRKSQQARGLYKLDAPMKLAITGSPVLGSPGDLWSLLHWLEPKTYTSYWNFFHTYTEFYEGYQGRPVVIGVKNADALRFELADKMVRRTKREIHPTMQKPFDPIVYEPEMTKAQQSAYDKASKDFWLELARDLADNEQPSPANDPAELVGELEAGALDLERLRLAIPTAATRVLRLRQVATSPAVLEVEGESPPDSSGKLDSIVEVLSQDDRPWVMFTWFKRSAALLARRLEEAGLTARTFTGNDTKDERTDIADAFQAGEFQVICATISVGGVGINLHRASDCGFVEEDWVPEINNQAFARVDRMGQEQRPQRHIWRTKDSVDTGRIAPTNATKTLITKTLMGGE